MYKPNIFSAFDGIGCGRIGLERVGITPDHYFASEIEESPIRIAMYNYPDIIQLGDIIKIKLKTIYLSEAYDYLCKKYFNGNIQSLQSIISRREMLYRINKKENFSAYFGTQESRKKGKTRSNTPISINDRIWFWKNPMEDFKGLYDIIRSGDRREISNTLNVGKLCEHSFWWNGNRQYESRIEKKSVEGIIRTNIKQRVKGIDSSIIESIFLNNGIKRSSENKSNRAISRSNEKTRQDSNGIKKTTNSRDKTARDVSNIKEVLQISNESDGIINDNWNIPNFYKKVQITMVECEWGLIIFKGKIQITLAGSPCQSFSSAGSRSGFNGKSGLFWEYNRLNKEIKPDYFLFENVEMKKEWENVLSNILGVSVHHINSSLVSGQNRPRIFLTNIPYTPIKDKEIMLGDDVPGAICGTNTHGKSIGPNPSKPGKFLYKHNGWEDMTQHKGCCLVTSRGHYRNIQGKVIGYTPENAEHLQRLPNGYTNVPGVSNTNRHKAIGNGWTVDILVEAFFKNLPWATKMKVNPMYSDKNV
jgi:DNA (cytosine-5)-methyltransferase 3A